MKISGINNLFGQFSADVTNTESIVIKVNGTLVLEAMKDGIIRLILFAISEDPKKREYHYSYGNIKDLVVLFPNKPFHQWFCKIKLGGESITVYEDAVIIYDKESEQNVSSKDEDMLISGLNFKIFFNMNGHEVGFVAEVKHILPHIAIVIDKNVTYLQTEEEYLMKDTYLLFGYRKDGILISNIKKFVIDKCF